MLNVNEIFGPTIQGEGECTGMPAIFIRFSGCNMWSGHPEEKAVSLCPFCDTDFLNFTLLTPEQIAAKVNSLNTLQKEYLIVLTGGEPLLQDEEELCHLCQILHGMGLYKIQIETNGTINKNMVLKNINYIVCSPKVPWEKIKICIKDVSSWKILYPHPLIKLDPFINMANDKQNSKTGFYLQPIEDSVVLQTGENLKKTIEMVKFLGYPWRLSLQTHKIIGEK